MVDITFNGMTMEFDVVEQMMDPELKDKILSGLQNPSEQQILDCYMKEHKARFGTEFLQA